MFTKALAILAMLFAAASGPASARAATTAPATTPATSAALAPAVVIDVSGMIDDYTFKTVKKHLDDARSRGASHVVLKLNTPGGLVSAAMDLTRLLRRQDDLHVIAYVEQQAYSAGTMVALACDDIVMQRDARIGDAAPIAVVPGGGVESLGATERGKIESPILEDFRVSAEQNGYDPYLVGAMVTLGRVVHWVQHPDGIDRRFVNADDYKRLIGEGWTPVPGVGDPVDAADTLLTVDSERALKLGLSKATVPDLDALVRDRNLSVVATFIPSTGERFVRWLGGPVVRLLLLVGFLMSLYVATHTPGHGVPEAAALVCLAMLLGIPLLTGYAQWYEIVAIVLGLALLALELFVIPGFGVPGIAGITLLLGGLLMTFVPEEPGRFPVSLPTLAATRDAMATGLYVITAGLGISALLALWLRRYLPKLPYVNRLILSGVAGEGGGGRAVVVGDSTAWPHVGVTGVAVTDLRPAGSSKFVDESAGVERLVSVVSDGPFIRRGDAVVVYEASGNRVVVRATVR